MRATTTCILMPLLILMSFLAACAGGTAAPATSSQTGKQNIAYENVLVLAVAENYDGRAQYERAVASNLRKLGVSATPYHSAVGGSGDISKERAQALIVEHGFDAILVTRVRDSASEVKVEQDSAGTKVSRRDDRPIDFFRYDYEVLNEPGEISVVAEATLDTELYSARTEASVWTYSWSSKGAENTGLLIDQSASAVVSRLKRDKLIDN